MVKSYHSYASASSSSVITRKSRIESSLIYTPTKKEMPKFERLLLKMSVANGFPFQWINHPATLELFEFLNPLLVYQKEKFYPIVY